MDAEQLRSQAGEAGGLGRLVRSIVGLDRSAAEEALADFVSAPGFGLELVRFAVDAEPVARTKFILHTRDMHRLYAKLGFAPPDARLMERWPGT